MFLFFNSLCLTDVILMICMHICRRFNAFEFLEKLRGKRLVYVGDSINRNQWESMLCILRRAVPESGGSFRAAHRGRTVAYVINVRPVPRFLLHILWPDDLPFFLISMHVFAHCRPTTVLSSSLRQNKIPTKQDITDWYHRWAGRRLEARSYSGFQYRALEDSSRA